jgi:hypothetical protein
MSRIEFGRMREPTMRMLFWTVLVATLASSSLAFAQPSKKAIAPRASQSEFYDFITRFRAALKANDAAAVASMTRLPFEYDVSYADATAFRTKGYPAIFTKKTRACLQHENPVYDRDGENKDNYFIFCGENIFTFTEASSGFWLQEIGAND